MRALVSIEVERTWDGRYRLVELRTDGFVVYGTWDTEGQAMAQGDRLFGGDEEEES